MGSTRDLARRLVGGIARRVSAVVGKDELFEKPGERPTSPPLPPRAAAAPPAPPAPRPADAPAPGPPAPAPVTAPAPPPAAPLAAPAPTPAPPSNGYRVPRERQAQCTLADLEQLRAAALGPGRLRVINHWATWCIPCVEEFPQLKALQASIAERHGEEVDFFGISWDLFDPRGEEEEIIDHVENFGVGHHLRWPTLLVAEAVPPADFFATLGITVEKVPQTWVVAADGRLVRRWDGLLKAEDLPVLLATLETAR